MKLSRTTKIWLGIGTIWPICYIVLFFVFVFTMMGTFILQANTPGRQPDFPMPILAIIPFHLFTMLLVIALYVFYIIYVIKDQRIDQTMKIVWIVLFFFTGVLTMPAFYFLYIWKEPAVNPKPAAPL